MCCRWIAFSLIVVIVAAAALVSGCVGTGNFVFLKHRLDKNYSASLDSGLVPMPLIDPVYSFDEQGRKLNPLLQPSIKGESFALLYGYRITAHGFPINGEYSYLVPVKKLPFENRYPENAVDIVISSLAADGTVHFAYRGQNITLKPGEAWSARRATTETLNSPNGSISVGVEVNDSISNYGYLGRSDLV